MMEGFGAAQEVANWGRWPSGLIAAGRLRQPLCSAGGGTCSRPLSPNIPGSTVTPQCRLLQRSATGINGSLTACEGGEEEGEEALLENLTEKGKPHFSLQRRREPHPSGSLSTGLARGRDG